MERTDLRPASRRGITLIEVLVAMTIFTMIVAAVMRFSDYVGRRIVTIRDEVKQMEELVGFLKTFSADVRGGRQILHSAPSEIGVWRADENADSAPEPSETIGYAWDGESPGRLYRQEGEDTSIALTNVQDLKLRYDRPSPRTRHIILDLAVGPSASEVQRYHFSLNLRVSELDQ